jgi:peptidyl-prolyl cis-trans isomerase B (cyclophilin B)
VKRSKDGRAHQKRRSDGREVARARRAAELRRRRLIRTGGLVLVSAIIASIGLVAVAGDEPPAPRPTKPPQLPVLPEGCSSTTPPPAHPARYDEPQQVLRRGVDYRAVIRTSCGDIEVDLDEQAAPQTVNSFVFLAREGFFDGLAWHRIRMNSFIQTGDPGGDGTGGPGYAIPDELPDKSRKYVFGTVAMANSGPNTGGSQFFIVTHDPPQLDPETRLPAPGEEPPEPAGFQPLYSIFGRVDEHSYRTIETLNRVSVGTDLESLDRPLTPVFVTTVDIHER